MVVEGGVGVVELYCSDGGGGGGACTARYGCEHGAVPNADMGMEQEERLRHRAFTTAREEVT